MGCHRLSLRRYCDVLAGEIEHMAEVVERADPATAVPTCPGWTMAELVHHIGDIHRWAAQMVRELRPDRLAREEMETGFPVGGDATALASWLRAGSAPTISAFTEADLDAGMWAWGPDQHVRFWPRRMVHETTVHRVDAELAVEASPEVEVEIAVDGVCELFENLPSAARFAPRVAALRGAGERLRFTAADAGVSWTVTLGPDGIGWTHDGDGDDAGNGDAEVTVRASAADLLLLVYGRRPPSADEVDGDAALLERWRANASI